MKKMRKILPLVLLAIASVFMLSSCDALLDGIFSNNTINVYANAIGYFPYGAVYITVSGPANVSTWAAYQGYDSGRTYWAYSFPKLSNGTYTVQAEFFANGYTHTAYSIPVNITVPYGHQHTVNVDIPF
jgi:hypothetical protein